MKPILVILIACLTISLSFAQGIQFESGSWADVLTKAEKENKLVFLDAYTTWCGPCKKMEKQVFTQREVGAYFNQKFINVKMDMEKGEGKALVKKYNIQSYPTFLFINGKGEVAARLDGFMDSKQLIERVKAAFPEAK